MPSRKKAKGKARKAAKEAKAKVAGAAEESQAVGEVAAGQRQVQEGSLEEQLQRLVISATSPKLCRHGCPLSSLSAGNQKICEDFINAYLAAFHSQAQLGQAFITADYETKVKYPDVYASKMDTVISMLLARGAQYILDGENRKAQLFASLACYFEIWISINVATKGPNGWAKVFELYGSDDHTLVSYYRKRISCSCLDEKYKEVKSVKKMGCCYNSNCSRPGRKVERSKMLCCTRCSSVNYCSVACQRANWKIHKKVCDDIVQRRAHSNHT